METRIDILIPILGRSPTNMIRSLEDATTTPFDVFFICTPGDDEMIAACRETGYTTWIPDFPAGRANFAKKINWAFARTNSEWVFQGADDIRFRPNWDVEALKVSLRAGVVGTNDLHNPSVKAGLSATHILFRRSYIEDYGGTFDGSGIVFSEAYDHQWVDNEFIELAKHRHQWVFAKNSHVEHLHPIWGDGEWDATYDKAFRESKEDQALFAVRAKKMKAGLR